MRFDIKTRTGLISPIIEGLSGTPGILNSYPNATAAYSLRVLNTSYTGAAIRVRRSSDNTELDIGFDSVGNLDTTTLLNFVGVTGNGFVTRWYDQSGNTRTATQTTAANQPIIVSIGLLETQLGKPCVRFSKVTGNGLATSVIINNPFSIIGVMSQDLSTGNVFQSRMLSTTSAATGSTIVIRRSDNISIYTSVTVLTNFPSQISNQPYLISFLRQTSTSNIYQNNITVANSSTTTSNWGGFEMNTPTYDTTNASLWRASEIIVYPTNQNANISGIHSNINSYYSIY